MRTRHVLPVALAGALILSGAAVPMAAADPLQDPAAAVVTDDPAPATDEPATDEPATDEPATEPSPATEPAPEPEATAVPEEIVVPEAPAAGAPVDVAPGTATDGDPALEVDATAPDAAEAPALAMATLAADADPFDEYVCGRDSVQYQVELNFGQDALPAPRTITFSFDIGDQGVTTRGLRYTTDVDRLCSSSVPGVYSGTTRMVSRTGIVTCTLNVEAGVSGSILLPPINIEAVPNIPFSQYVRPTLTFDGVAQAVPPATVISIPQQDARLSLARPAANATQTPNPVLLVVDGIPGLAIAAATDYSYVSFNPAEWAQFKGLPTRATAVMDYTVGSYVQGDGVDAPRALPDGALVLTNSTAIPAGSVFEDTAGNPVDVRAMAAGSLPMSVGLWLPLETIIAQGGFGLWVHADAHSITDELGNPNFGSTEPWDPGTGELCSFSTASLGIPGVTAGATMPNNNCFRYWYTYGEYTEGPTAKLIDSSASTQIRSFRESHALPVTLFVPARITHDTGDLVLCDAWDAPAQTAEPRSASQLDVNRVPTVTALVGTRTLTLPATVWRVEYAHSQASLAGSYP